MARLVALVSFNVAARSVPFPYLYIPGFVTDVIGQRIVQLDSMCSLDQARNAILSISLVGLQRSRKCDHSRSRGCRAAFVCFLLFLVGLLKYYVLTQSDPSYTKVTSDESGGFSQRLSKSNQSLWPTGWSLRAKMLGTTPGTQEWQKVALKRNQ